MKNPITLQRLGKAPRPDSFHPSRVKFNYYLIRHYLRLSKRQWRTSETSEIERALVAFCNCSRPA